MELMNEITKKWVDAYIERPSSTLLIDCANDSLSGDDIAEYICSQLSKDSHVPIVHLKANDKKSIGIDDVRQLQRSFQLKANTDSKYTRFVVINDAGVLTPEAQNSLLKLMEELPEKTILIIICDNIQSLLETVKSRCFQVRVLPITEKAAFAYGSYNGHSDALIRKAYLLSEGYSSKFIKLLNDDQDSLYELVDIAKKFISDSVFERQKYLQTLNSNKSNYSYEDFTNALKLTAKSGMRFANSTDTKTHWKNILKVILRTDQQVDRNVSEKLALLSLSVSL